MIEKIKNEVIDICKAYEEKEGYDYWESHLKYVLQYSIELAEEVGANLEIIKLSALLHDIAKPLEIGKDSEHNINSAKIAEEILEKYNFPSSKIYKVKECIIYHYGDITDVKLSKEAWCIRNADVLSMFNNISILYYLAFKEYNKSYSEGCVWVKDTIKNKYNKLDYKLQKKYKKELEKILETI